VVSILARASTFLAGLDLLTVTGVQTEAGLAAGTMTFTGGALSESRAAPPARIATLRAAQ
jgi:hypothetical protein